MKKEINEWEIDTRTGRRFKRVGNCIEYEPTITIDGMEVPQSQLAEFNAKRKKAKEQRAAEEREELKARPETKSCPFNNGIKDNCIQEDCRLYFNGSCSIAIIADNVGKELDEENTVKKCPFSNRRHCGDCALNNKGCAIVRYAASTYERKEGK